MQNLPTFTVDEYSYTQERGNKFFELSNHLGNVLVTVSDRVVQKDVGVFAQTLTCPPYNATAPNALCYYAQTSTTPDGMVDYYEADIVTASDYYPFGMTMPGRSFEQTDTKYRYGFNGQEKSDEIFEGSTTALFWEYDSRTGRRWNVDPVIKVWESPYLTFGGNSIAFADPLGDDNYYSVWDSKTNKTTTYRVKNNDNGNVYYSRADIVNKNFDPTKCVDSDFKAYGSVEYQAHKGFKDWYNPVTMKTEFIQGKAPAFKPETTKNNQTVTATNDKVEGSPTQSEANTNSEKPQTSPVPKATQKAFDYAGAISTTVQGVSSGFLRGERLAKLSSLEFDTFCYFRK